MCDPSKKLVFHSKRFSIKIDMVQAWDLSQVVSILSPFLAFATSFFPTKVHSMLTMMLDLRFTGMKVVREFVGNDVLT
jgi:hypothetical protein